MYTKYLVLVPVSSTTDATAVLVLLVSYSSEVDLLVLNLVQLYLSTKCTAVVLNI
jgi:hypothetical protein